MGLILPSGSHVDNDPGHTGDHNLIVAALQQVDGMLGDAPEGAYANVDARLDALDSAWPAADAAHVAAGDPHGDRAYAAALVDDLSGVTNAATARTNLGLGDAATKNTGTTTGTVAAGDDSRIVGALPASLVDAKGDLIAASADNTPARLAVGAEGDVLTVLGSASTGLAWAQPQPRNLLTVNQSSIETDTTGLGAFLNCTVARSTAVGGADGSAALAVTSTSGVGNVYGATSTGTAGVPVVAGRLYSAMVSSRAATTPRPTMVGITWYASNGGTVGTSLGSVTTNETGSWTAHFLAAVAPATAVYANIFFGQSTTAPALGEVHYYDRLSLHEGYGGTWALGGQPIQGIGERWDETVGRRCFRWDWNNSREQMVYGDTGWRDVTPENGWTATTMRIRRVGMTVEFSAAVVNGSASSSTTAYTIPSGFQSVEIVQIPVGYTSSAIADAPLTNIITALIAGGTRTAFTSSRWSMTWTTTNAWPTSLPGVASGSIPAS